VISIIIPVYNSEKYLEECLRSIYNQTYKNVEIIIINDGSTDNSDEIVNRYKNKFLKFQYYSQKNKGASDARNLGVEKANGEFLMFIDSDDYIEENTLELMYKKITQNNADMVIIGHKKIYNQEKKIEKYLFDVEERKKFSNTEVLQKILNFEVRGYICDKLFRKKLWKKLKISFESRRYCEDWYPITKYTVESKDIVFINEPLYNYRQHSESSINSSNIEVVRDYNYAVNQIIKYVENNGIKCSNKDKNTFKMLTLCDSIHEFYNINKFKGNKVYSFFDEEKFNFWKCSLKDIFIDNNLKLKTKFSILFWKFKIYHYFK